MSRTASPPPLPFVPRGLTKAQAAAYLGVGVTFFDQKLREGIIKPPKKLGSQKRYDVRDLDEVFDNLDYEGEENPFDLESSGIFT